MQRNQTSISTPPSRLKQSTHLPFSTTAATFRFSFGQFGQKQVYQGIFPTKMWFYVVQFWTENWSFCFYIFVHLI